MNTGWVKAREPLFDALFGLLAAFYTSYQEFLKPDALLARLNKDGQIKLVDYLSNLLTDPTIPIHSEEADFFAALEQEEVDFTLHNKPSSRFDARKLEQ